MRAPTAKNPKTFLERDDWVRAVVAANLPHATARIAVAIGMHLRVESGRCNPRYKTVSGASHVSERSVFRHVELLVRTGWLALEQKIGCSNQHFLLTPANSMAEVGDQPLPNRARTPAKSRGGPLPNRGGTPANRLADKKRNSEEEQRRGTKTLSRSALASERPSPELASRGEKRKRPSEEGRKEKRKPPAPRADAAESAFAEFFAAYPRRVAKEAARKAWSRAIEGGAEPERLIAGAKRYAVERAGQEPRYTKHPATWLNAGCWEDESPGAETIDEAGNVVAIEQPEHEGESQSIVERALEMLEEAAGGDPDSWYVGGTK
jgi:hypothetical protein